MKERGQNASHPKRNNICFLESSNDMLACNKQQLGFGSGCESTYVKVCLFIKHVHCSCNLEREHTASHLEGNDHTLPAKRLDTSHPLIVAESIAA